MRVARSFDPRRFVSWRRSEWGVRRQVVSRADNRRPGSLNRGRGRARRPGFELPALSLTIAAAAAATPAAPAAMLFAAFLTGSGTLRGPLFGNERDRSAVRWLDTFGTHRFATVVRHVWLATMGGLVTVVTAR
jgi:hypothetical protein